MSEVRVNKLSPRSGTTVTLGDSGDTISIPSGVTLSNAGTNTFASATITGDLTVDTNTLYVDSTNNRVGIGTTSPETLLHLESTGVVSQIAFENDARQWRAGVNGNIADYFTIYDHTALQTRLVIDTSGNVGIGTTSPGRLFEISSTNPYLSIKSTNDSTGTSQIFFGDTADDNVGRINYDHSNNAMLFLTSATERMRIDSSGFVGIGTSSPSKILQVSSNDPVIRLTDTDTGATHSLSGSSSVRNFDLIVDDGGSSGSPRFSVQIQNSGKFYILNDGNVGIGTSSPTTALRVIGQISTESATNGNGFSQNCIGTPANYYFDVRDDNTGIFRIISNKRIQTNGGTNMIGALNLIGERGQNFKALAFEHTGGGGEVGSITTTSSSTSYNTSSDYRLKENVNYDFDATTRLKQLKPARFNFIADANTTVDGFLAHEVSSVVPEAISGTKDAVQVWEEGDELPEGVSVGDNKLDENGNTIPQYQGIDQSKLVPLLVKTIQELEARITALETNNP